MSTPKTAPLLLLAAAILTCVGCRERTEDPEETLRTFLADARTGRADPAWKALTEANRKELTARHEEIARAAGKAAGEPSPGAILFNELGLLVLDTPESIVMTSPPGREIVLRVTVKDGREADFKMIREGSEWKVDLLGSLKPPSEVAAAKRRPRTLTTDTATVP